MTARSEISVAIIEDNRLVRDGLVALLTQADGFAVVAAMASVEAECASAAPPHAVLLDLGLGNEDSLRAVDQVKQKFPMARIIMMDVLPINEDVMEFVNAGVSGFILKDATLDEVFATIRSVAAGAHVLPPAMTGTLFSQIAKDAIAKGEPKSLEAVRMTAREREVINLIAEGLSNKEIASRLNIATHTVKSHVRNVMEKLMLHTRLQIAAYAHRET
jgi:DNA-binding NarL/FixJ family response regulator